MKKAGDPPIGITKNHIPRIHSFNAFTFNDGFNAFTFNDASNEQAYDVARVTGSRPVLQPMQNQRVSRGDIASESPRWNTASPERLSKEQTGAWMWRLINGEYTTPSKGIAMVKSLQTSWGKTDLNVSI